MYVLCGIIDIINLIGYSCSRCKIVLPSRTSFNKNNMKKNIIRFFVLFIFTLILPISTHAQFMTVGGISQYSSGCVLYGVCMNHCQSDFIQCLNISCTRFDPYEVNLCEDNAVNVACTSALLSCQEFCAPLFSICLI